MYVLMIREKLLSYAIPKPSEVWESWKEILHIGIPNALTKMIIPLGNGFITRIIASFGAAAVAGYGVATRLEFFSLAALNALSAIIGPFIGQNLGANKMERVKAGFTTSGHFSLYVGGILFCIYLIFAAKIAAFFNTDPNVISTAALYLRVVSLAYAAQGFYLVVSAGLNVMKRPLQAAGLSILEIFGLAVPLALLGSHLFGMVGVFGAIAFSYTSTGVIALITIRRVLLKYE